MQNVTNESLVRALAGGAVDIIIGDMQTLAYVAKKEGVYDTVRFLDRVLRVVPRYIVFPRSHGYHAAKFEAGLEAIKEKGIYDKIMMEWE